jgi:hypothetical protein
LSRRLAFRWAFLIITGLAVGWELVAAFDSSPDTEPWTDLIAEHVSPWVTFSAIGLLVLWLPWHFVQRYKRKQASEEN